MTEQPLRHAVLGVGGVGGTLAVMLAEAGHSVQLIMRSESHQQYDGAVTVEGAITATAAIEATSRLSAPVDILWVTVKAPQLVLALDSVPPALIAGCVIPLLNGVDHLTSLRARFGAEMVVAGAIRMHAQRTAVGRIQFKGWHAGAGDPDLLLAPGSKHRDLISGLRDSLAGVIKIGSADELSLVWGKIADLATLGAASAIVGTMGAARDDSFLGPLARRAVVEVVNVATYLGAHLDSDAILRRHGSIEPTSTSSLYRDLSAGRTSEICAILDPPIREGLSAEISVRSLITLRQLILDRFGLGTKIEAS